MSARGFSAQTLGQTLALTLALTLGGGLACDKAKVIIEEPEPSGGSVEGREGAPSEAELAMQEAVRTRARSYAAALDGRDADAAEASVSSDTFVYYEDLRRIALSSGREQLERLDLMTVLLVLQIRAKLSRAELEGLEGRELFRRAVSEGFVGSDTSGIPLEEVWLDDAGERAQIRVDAEPVIWLRLEQGSWRVDIPEMIRVLGPALEALALERVVADGKVFTAYKLLSQSEEVDMGVLDGPL